MILVVPVWMYIVSTFVYYLILHIILGKKSVAFPNLTSINNQPWTFFINLTIYFGTICIIFTSHYNMIFIKLVSVKKRYISLKRKILVKYYWRLSSGISKTKYLKCGFFDFFPCLREKNWAKDVKKHWNDKRKCL